MRDLIKGFQGFLGDPDGRETLAIASVVIAAGTVFYRFVEDLLWIDSLYFSVITLTTVCYGDISPTTTPGKVFTMFYVIAGIGIFVALVSQVGAHLMEARKQTGSRP